MCFLWVQAAHMSREANNEKPPALGMSRAASGHLVEGTGASFTAMLNRSATDIFLHLLVPFSL